MQQLDIGEAFYLNIIAGSGGPSGCASGKVSSGGVVSGTCKGYPKPSWQSGLFGNPSDGVRDIPDVSLFAANGVWGHYYVVCWSDPSQSDNGGASCSGMPDTWAGFGGTSISSPIMAGDSSAREPEERAAPRQPESHLLLARQYRVRHDRQLASCNSTLGNGVAELVHLL